MYVLLPTYIDLLNRRRVTNICFHASINYIEVKQKANSNYGTFGIGKSGNIPVVGSMTEGWPRTKMDAGTESSFPASRAGEGCECAREDCQGSRATIVLVVVAPSNPAAAEAIALRLLSLSSSHPYLHGLANTVGRIQERVSSSAPPGRIQLPRKTDRRGLGATRCQSQARHWGR